MAQTVRRQTKGVRSQARAADTDRRVRKARSTGSSLLGWLLGLLPFTDEQLRRGFTVLILASAAALAWVVAQASGANVLAAQQFAAVTAHAGYTVQEAEVHGVTRMDPNDIKYRAMSKPDLAMASYDIAGLRAELMELPWVKDARVARQLPNVLVINIIEREPHAALRRGDQLLLIDATGAELAPVSAADARGMLLITGEGAAGQVEALSALLEAAPALRSQVTAADWTGHRRWDLRFVSGQRLSLPEGETRSADALVRFAQLDGVHRLIGGTVASFDLRNSPRMYMREPGRSEGREINIEQEEI